MYCFQKSHLITQLDDAHFLQLFLTLASSSTTKDFNPFNVFVLDILHLMFRGVEVSNLVKDQKAVRRPSR